MRRWFCLEVVVLADGRFNVEFVTVTNDANRAWRLLQTAPWPVRVLGPLGNRTWSDHLRDAHLLIYVRDLLRRGLNDTVVILLDAWDVAWLGCRRDLGRAFRAMRRPLFFSAELGFYPFGQPGLSRISRYPAAIGLDPLTSTGYSGLPRCSVARGLRSCRPRLDETRKCTFCAPESAGGGYRFVNNGCYGGYAWALERALSRMYQEGRWRNYAADHQLMRGLSWRGLTDLTQGAWHAYLMQHPHEIALDYGASICVNLHGFETRRAFRRRQDGRIFAKPFGRDVCFAHANGDADLAFLDWAISERNAQKAHLGPASAARLRSRKPLLQ